MGTLNPTIPSPELTKTLNAAAARMKALGKPFLTPALLLATFARDADNAAHRLLTSLAIERSFRLDELAIVGRDAGEGQPRRRCGLRFHSDGRLACEALHRDAGGAR